MVAEEYLKDRDMDRIWKKYMISAIEEIVGYLGGTDGDDPERHPRSSRGMVLAKEGPQYWPAYLSLMGTRIEGAT